VDNQDIKRAGLKVTGARLKIMELLRTTARHMSAEEVYSTLHSAGEDVGLATVYRVLTQFEAAGLVKRRHFAEGHSVFEIDQGEHHDHLVCVKCGRVEEFVDDAIEQRQAAIVKKMGYQMTDHTLTIYGVCPNCSKKM
jgi:Fur family transcriptional regulator, ferric uptake regulator